MKVGDLVCCVGRGPGVIGIVVEIEEDFAVSTPRIAQVMTDRGLEWWPECLVEVVQ